MDGNKFDALARNLGSGMSRRQLLKGLFGGAAAMTASTVVREHAAAQPGTDVPIGGGCSHALQNCASGLECCGPGTTVGTCLPPGVCDNLITTPCDLYGCPGITICCEGVCSGSEYFGCPGDGDGDDDDDDEEIPEEPTTTTTLPPDDEETEDEETPWVEPEPGSDGTACIFGLDDECAPGLTCCPFGPILGRCRPVAHCEDPTIRPCIDGGDCIGGLHFTCCPSGFCSDGFGVCPEPTTTTPDPGEPTTTTPSPGDPTTTTPGPGDPTTTTPGPGEPTTTTPDPGDPTTTTPAPSNNTQPGQNVVVSAGSGTLTFANVTSPGTTTVVQTLPTGTLPDSSVFDIANGTYYDISTTATFSPPVTVCLPSSNATDRLLHFTGGAWVDITSPGSPSGGQICGVTGSLSPFAVVPLLGWTGDDDDDDDDDDGHGGLPPHRPHPPKKPNGSSSAASLPNTGSGSTASGGLSQLGATLAASAAAMAAARLLRHSTAEDESAS